MSEHISGFTLVSSRPLEELSATLHEYEHDSTGAKLVWLDRAEENKTFGISFTTLPYDSTGIFHILEHSVLCGSDQYPVKEPFVELMKHSMNTFLNAMTFPDKTMYPISSRNDKDFINLMKVYLDAVFHPSIYHKPEIFQQEGWHYELDEQGAPSYKGVVFNEMKGALADADTLQDHALLEALYPDTPYRWVSGGDPAVIPDLTYEGFLAGHKKFYSPSNSFIFLDGAMDLAAVLAVLDGVLSGIQRGERIAPPALQAPCDGGETTVTYEVASEKEEKDHTRVAFGRSVGSWAEREKIIGAQILSDVLCGSNQAPLTKAVLEKGLAENVIFQVQDGVSQPYLCLELRNIKDGCCAEAEQTLWATLQDLAQNGLDREMIRSSMANLEFQMRERDFGSYPQGIVFCIQTMESWLYGGAPEKNLQIGDLFTRLAQKMDEGWFEQLLRELVLDNPHRCKVTMVPSRTAGEARRAAEAQRLAAESSAWTGADRARLQAQQDNLLAWQNSEDTPEQLATLPCLALSDLSDTPEQLPMEQKTLEGIPTLLHEVNTGGIQYVKLYFDADGYSEEELSRMAFLADLLGVLKTRRHSAQELSVAQRLICGVLGCHVSNYALVQQPQSCKTKFCLSFSALDEKLGAAIDLAAEILNETCFEEEKEVRDILRQNKMQMMQQMTMGGHMVAMKRVSAQLYPVGVADECVGGGFQYYQWLKQQDENWDWQTLRTQLEALRCELVAKNRLTISITGQTAQAASLTAEKLAGMLPERAPKADPCTLKPWGVCREGIVIPADIAFAYRGGDLYANGGSAHGAWKLAANIVSLSYLWNVIRVQGGAYGTGLLTRANGFAGCYSYRDPNGAKSLQSYLGGADFLAQMCKEEPDLTGFIIGTVSDAEPLLTPRAKGTAADSLYLQGITWEQRCEQRRQLLEATPAQLAQMASVLKATLENGGICVIGGKNQIDQCELDTVKTL